MNFNQRQIQLHEMIERIFADGVLEEHEHAELRAFWTSAQLSVPQVRAVVDAFVQETWGEIIADGVVTADEGRRLACIVDSLHLPAAALPDVVRKAVAQQRR